jgi:hypothetical protein
MDAQSRRRYMAGDTVRLELIVEHAMNLSRLFVAFSHEKDHTTEMYFETTTFLEQPGEDPGGGSEGAPRRSRVELFAPVAPETVPGVYNLTRANLFSASGRLARLRGTGLAGASGASFEVVEEPQEPPTILDFGFGG